MIKIIAAVITFPVFVIDPSGKPVDSILPNPAIQCMVVIFRAVENPQKYYEFYSFSPYFPANSPLLLL
jgi:hypothetical protein